MTQFGSFYPYCKCDICGDIEILWNVMNPNRSSWKTFYDRNFCCDLCKDEFVRVNGKDALYARDKDKGFGE